MRNCKALGISLELWKPSFIRAWIAENAETYRNKEGKTLWRKKSPGQPTQAPEPEPQARQPEWDKPDENPRPMSDAQHKKLRAELHKLQFSSQEQDSFLKWAKAYPDMKPTMAHASTEIETIADLVDKFIAQNEKPDDIPY